MTQQCPSARTATSVSRTGEILPAICDGNMTSVRSCATDRRPSASKKHFLGLGDSCGIRGRDDPSRALEADVAIRRGKGSHSALDGVDDSGQVLDTDLAYQPGDRSYLS